MDERNITASCCKCRQPLKSGEGFGFWPRHYQHNRCPGEQERWSKFSGDWEPEDAPTREGWTDGRVWNGWAMPWFPRAEADRLVREIHRDFMAFRESQTDMHWEGDDVIESYYWIAGGGDRTRMLEGRSVVSKLIKKHPSGIEVPIWSLGDGFCWNEHDLKCKQCGADTMQVYEDGTCVVCYYQEADND